MHLKVSNIPPQPSQTCELEGDRIRECHWRSACSLPAEEHTKHMQVKHSVLYLHYTLKHMGQRQEGDDHIFTCGLQCFLDDARDHTGRDRRGSKTDGQRKIQRGIKERQQGPDRDIRAMSQLHVFFPSDVEKKRMRTKENV